MLNRRRLGTGAALAVACLLCAAQATAHEAAPPKQQQQLLEQGQALLRQGRLDEAQSAIEQAIAIGHSPSAELVEVQLAMRRGEYRHALALAAHVAGEEEHPGAAASLYAALLNHGGQVALARQVAERITPPAAAASSSSPALTGQPLPCTAVLLDDGAHALVPHAALHGSQSLELVDTAGGVHQATLVRADDTSALALLRLDPAARAATRWAAADPFAGSPGSIVGFAAHSAPPELPTLRVGFVGALTRDSIAREPGIALDGADGAAMLNAKGQAVGIVVQGPDQRRHWWPVSALRRTFPEATWPVPPTTAPARWTPTPLDAVYEQALQFTLRVRPRDAGG